MIAITVVLAAMIATVAIGMGGDDLHKTKIIATKIEQSGSDIRVTFTGGTIDPDLIYMTIIAPNGSVFFTTSATGSLSYTGIPVRPDVGSGMILYGAGTAGYDHVTVVGHFNDGSAQVLLEKDV